MDGDDMLDDSYIEAFKSLGWNGQFEGIVDGIFQQAVAGERPLSPRQIEVIRDVVDRFCGSHICKIHQGTLEVDDVDAYLDCGCCSYHQYVMAKDD